MFVCSKIVIFGFSQYFRVKFIIMLDLFQIAGDSHDSLLENRMRWIGLNRILLHLTFETSVGVANNSFVPKLSINK